MKYLQVIELGVYSPEYFLINATCLIKRLVHMYSIYSITDIVVSGVSSYYIAYRDQEMNGERS